MAEPLNPKVQQKAELLNLQNEKIELADDLKEDYKEHRNTKNSNQSRYIVKTNISQETNYSRNISNNNTYGIIKILIVYMIQTAIYVAFCKFKIIRSKEILYWPSAVLMASSAYLLFIIKGYDGSYHGKACCFALVFLTFFIFKIYFFIYIYYVVELIDLKNLYCSRKESSKADDNNTTDFGNFDFFNLAMFVYYLTLIIFTAIKKKIVLLFYFLVGLGISLIMFFSLFSIDIIFAGYTGILMILEVGIFLIVLKVTTSGKRLVRDEFLYNMLIIDYLKYLLLMVISFIILAIIYYIILCVLFFLKCLCEVCASRATSVDDKGNVYDQFGNFMAHYSTRPDSVDSEGNVYDKHHNKIQPDGCHIF